MGKTNKVILIGNFGNAIQMHHFDGGCIGRVALATTEKYKNKAGEVVSNVEWHNLVFRNKGAEVVEKYTEKGSKMYIEGRLKYTSWEKDGVKMYGTEIHVNEFEFLSTKDKDPNTTSSSAGPTPPPSDTPPDDECDDLPF